MIPYYYNNSLKANMEFIAEELQRLKDKYNDLILKLKEDCKSSYQKDGLEYKVLRTFSFFYGVYRPYIFATDDGDVVLETAREFKTNKDKGFYWLRKREESDSPIGFICPLDNLISTLNLKPFWYWYINKYNYEDSFVNFKIDLEDGKLKKTLIELYPCFLDFKYGNSSDDIVFKIITEPDIHVEYMVLCTWRKKKSY